MSLTNLTVALGSLSQALREVQDCLDLGGYRPGDLGLAWQALDATGRQLQEAHGYLLACEIPEAWKHPSLPAADERFPMRTEFLPLTENDPARHIGENSGDGCGAGYGTGNGSGQGVG